MERGDLGVPAMACRTSATGQQRRCWRQKVISGLPLKADLGAALDFVGMGQERN